MGNSSTAPTTLTAPQVLRSIPAHLDLYGWCQHFNHNAKGAACLRGAINDLTPIQATRAECYLRLQLYTNKPVIEWNDTPKRNIQEIKDACIAASDLDLDANLHGANLRDADLRGAVGSTSFAGQDAGEGGGCHM